MAHQLAPKAFLRLTSNQLLARYFHKRNLLLDLDIAALDDLEIDEVYRGWQGLPPPIRSSVDIDLGSVDDLATNEGIRTFVNQASVRGVDLNDLFAKPSGVHDKAMLAFLDFPEVFYLSLQFVQTDDLPERNWFKRRDLPEVFPKTDPNTLRLLESSIKYYFTENESRGHSCAVDWHRRDRRWYYFAYPEDYGGTFIEWGDNGLVPTPRRPAFEVVFVVNPEESTLDIFYRGSVKTKRDLQTIFARIVLGIELHANPKSEQLYDLNKLKGRDFSFVFERTSGITDVTIHKLRFTVLGGIKRTVTLEADAARTRFAVHDLMDEVFDSANHSKSKESRLPLAAFNVTQAQIRVRFYPLPGKRAQTRRFHLSYPNACPLKYEGNDLIIREMLRQSGLEIASTSGQRPLS